MAIRFSLLGSLRNIPQCIKWAQRIEELGYERFFSAEHQLLCLDSFQALGICAGATKRLRLGTGVTNMVFRDPTVLACSIATLNEISNGRAMLVTPVPRRSFLEALEQSRHPPTACVSPKPYRRVLGFGQDEM